MAVVIGTNVINVMPPKGPVRLWDCQTEWARIQPNPGEWYWDHLDNLVTLAGNRQIMLVVGHPPEWAAKDGADGKQAPWMLPGSNRPPKNDQLWATYIVAVANRYKGKINQYQVWNEPIDQRFYTGSYAELAHYVKRTKSIISRVDPSAKVVSPPLQPRKQAGWLTKGAKLLSALKAENFPFDIYAAHIYPQINEGIKGWDRDVQLVFAGLRKYEGPKKPIWITETNFNLGGEGNPYSDTRQLALKNNVISSANKFDIGRVFWYAYAYSNPSLIAVTNL